MKNIISKITLIAGIIMLTISGCKKDPNAEKELPNTGGTTIELAKGAALSSTGATGTSTVTLNYIVGEKLFPAKVIPKLTVFYLTNTQASTTNVRTQLFTASNVALAATPTPATGAPVVTAIGAYGNASNIVWGLTYTFTLRQLGAGLFNTSNGSTTNSRGTSIIVVAQDASNATIAEYTFAISEFGIRTAS